MRNYLENDLVGPGVATRNLLPIHREKSFLGFGASLLSSLPWREGVRGRGTGPPLPALRYLRRDWSWKWTVDSMARRRLPGGTKNVPDGRRLACGELNGKGYRVVRFWKSDILGDLEGVLESIEEALSGDKAVHPHPIPLPSRERDRRRERMAPAVPPLGASGFDIRGK